MKKIIFFATFFFTMVFWDFLIRACTVISLPLGQKFAQKMASRIAESLFTLARVYMGLKTQRRVTIPFDLETPFLIVSNHQSIIDIPFLYTCFPQYPIRFVAKEQLAHWVPLVSLVFRLQKHALVSRTGNFGQTMKELKKLGRNAKRRGFCPVVFPEGTRSRTGEVLPFHSGAVRTILGQNSMPVLCIAIDGGHQVAGTLDFAKNMKNAEYKIRVLHLFPAARDKKEIDRIIKTSREMIRKQIEKWTKKKLPGRNA